MLLTIANKIIKNKKYIEILKDIETLEKDRIFCGHNMEHFLDVARMTLILCKERSLDVSPDFIYTTALLHDIGRAQQYRNDVPHNIAGEKIAREILNEVGADKTFTDEVCKCILSHSTKKATQDSTIEFEKIFFIADKKSRNCFCCKAQDECNWPYEKRNMNIEF